MRQENYLKIYLLHQKKVGLNMVKSAIAYQYIERTPPQTHRGFPLLSLEVKSADCLLMARSIAENLKTPVCLLNNANQFEVGGDYLSGRGQEEYLIANTDLLTSLCQLPGVKKGNVSNPFKYQLENCLGFSNKRQRSGFGEFTCLYSEDVKIHSLNKKMSVNKDDTSINIISSAAYNLTEMDQSPDLGLYLIGTIFKILNQLRTAKTHNQRVLLLSAFGCGAFRNDPYVIAEIYQSAIYSYEFQGCFDHIYFPIKDAPEDTNFEVFKNQFTKCIPRPLSDLMNHAITLLKPESKLPQLEKMLDSFFKIESTRELFFITTQFIIYEKDRLSLLSKTSASKILFLDNLLNLLNDSPANTREIIETALKKSDLFTPSVGLFHGVKYKLFGVFENLLKHMPIKNSSTLNPTQIDLANEYVQNYIIAKADEFINSCYDKEIACFLVYLASQKDTAVLNAELSFRFNNHDYKKHEELLRELHALCVGKSNHKIFTTIADIRFCSESNSESWKKAVANHLAEYISDCILIHLQNYMSFDIQEFEQVIANNSKFLLDTSFSFFPTTKEQDSNSKMDDDSIFSTPSSASSSPAASSTSTASSSTSFSKSEELPLPKKYKPNE